MRTRLLLALIALPAICAAQFPHPRRALGPTELPPTTPEIARQLQWQRLRVSFETYPMLMAVSAPGFAGGAVASGWTTGGVGSRADYRITPRLSATMDMTSSFAGGPANLATLELGGRYRPEWSARRLYPFLDARIGYVYTYYSGAFEIQASQPQGQYYSRSTQGLGALAGGGVEWAVSRLWSVTSGVAVMRSRMSQASTNANIYTPDYSMTAIRWTIGVKYNPIRFVTN